METTITAHEETCPICIEKSLEAAAVLNCNHIVCFPCLEVYLNMDIYPKKCPICRCYIEKFTVKKIAENFVTYRMRLKKKTVQLLQFSIKNIKRNED